MAGLFGGLFGGRKPSVTPNPVADDADFADFADAPDPSPVSLPISTLSAAAEAQPAFPTGSSSPVLYTKWYRIWERTSPKDFVVEAFILPVLVLVVLVHLWGTKTNKRFARRWMAAHGPIMQQEYAVVGFGDKQEMPSTDDKEITKDGELANMDDLLKAKSAHEFISYATGRQNVAFTDIQLSLYKRYNPLVWVGESVLGILFESSEPPIERMRITTRPFDGNEGLFALADSKSGQGQPNSQSSYDAFVWAVVHKDLMKGLRDDRYDLSLTTTKDHKSLPSWATVMSEAAEITDLLLTPALIEAIEAAGQQFEYLIVTDQPEEKPTKLEEITPVKRLYLSIRLPPASSPDFSSTIPFFSYFLRLPDQLVSSAHFRPQLSQKLRQVREDYIRKLQRGQEDEKAEERSLKRDKEKKEKRDATLRGLSAEGQKKFLEKERAKEMRKGMKKVTQRA